MNTRGRRRVGAGVWGIGAVAAAAWLISAGRGVTAVGYGSAGSVAVAAIETARIVELPKALHDPVGANEIVVRLDPGALEAERALAEATLLAVQQDQQLSQVNLARRFAEGVDSTLVERARLQVGLSEDRAALDALRDRLAVEQDLAATGASSTQAVEEWKRQIHVLEAKIGANESAISIAQSAASGAAARQGGLPSGNDWSVVAASRALDEIEARIASCQLKSGVDGEVALIDLRPGEVAVAGLPILQVRPTSTREVVAFVETAAVSRLTLGERASVRRASGQVLQGELLSIGSGPVALPIRLWLTPNDPRYGVAVRVRLSGDVGPDEDVTVRL